MSKSQRHKPSAVSSRRIGRTAWIAGGLAIAAAVTIGAAVFAGRSSEEGHQASATSATRAGSALPVVDVYKTPTCGCCSKWVDHLREEGFEVRTTDMRDLTDIKARHGVPEQLASCHTALVAGYVLEGHVPGEDVQRLLEERPAIAGVAVPGMPIGSPGMEIPGSHAQPYEVIAFRNDGSTQVFATHGR
ncbi:MAG TPA: DUF411 domain-containing protein [Steroidobacteraceae bacterium]